MSYQDILAYRREIKKYSPETYENILKLDRAKKAAAEDAPQVIPLTEANYRSIAEAVRKNWEAEHISLEAQELIAGVLEDYNGGSK